MNPLRTIAAGHIAKRQSRRALGGTDLKACAGRRPYRLNTRLCDILEIEYASIQADALTANAQRAASDALDRSLSFLASCGVDATINARFLAMPRTHVGRGLFRALVALGLVLRAPDAFAQAKAPQQDPALDNLRHAPSYRTAALGTLQQVVRHGTGPVDVVLIPGWGFGADVFASFMADNTLRYRMTAVTLPGFGGTSAPPIPPTGTSYSEGTWTRAAEEAIARLIVTEGLRRPIIVGHFVVGTQIALRLAMDHSELVGGVIIIGGSPVAPTSSRRDSTGKTPATYEERVRGIDRFLAPLWYRTVTKQTWDENNYPADLYSNDSVRARDLWRRSESVPLPVLIQYQCEFLASDISREYARISVPTRVLVPSFTPELLANPKQAYLKSNFIDAWESAKRANPLLVVRVVAGSRLFVMDDQPTVVASAIDELTKMVR
jgi:pimeloyl-ACP methyl ester carboxylesterase